MEQTKFIQQLESLAEIRKVKAARGPNMRPATDNNEVYRNGEIIVIDKNNNSTLNWFVKEVKHQPKQCNDCGKQVVNRRIWRRIFYTPDRHWRTTCSGCNLTQHPESGKYVVPNNIVVTVFRDWLSKRDK
jgi:hypothetical protein